MAVKSTTSLVRVAPPFGRRCKSTPLVDIDTDTRGGGIGRCGEQGSYRTGGVRALEGLFGGLTGRGVADVCGEIASCTTGGGGEYCKQ